ncbi:PfkB family carbohydrate kinase [Sulfuriflexus sp.]|uniref:PfkB family carbohydrate kinase n=1 Tax=Sulfuriflexus sp. TaxID=2015443 RepID=UPI0028CE1E4F|nr:PfkB family carbohydrate kinase [Sulfuriflexus sp.]MDT8404431.1 PfkB family carbohydrate kinase [Sulfuriflexus sp.]
MYEHSGRPVIFGEVLFDEFADGSAVLGGAPFNVAWHLQGFGLRPLLVSRVGQDERGELAFMRMHQWGMDMQAVQIDPLYPTGGVEVSLEDGEPDYVIRPAQAYDKISSALVLDLVSHLPCSLLYCGSLAQRDVVSRKTLQRLLLEQALPVFVDINRRPPWLDEANISTTLHAATCVKMNAAELAAQTGLPTIDDKNLQHAMALLHAQYNIRHIYITHADKGAGYFGEAGLQTTLARQPRTFVDSVGAGDAFAAVCLLGQIRQWPVSVTLARANGFAGMVCEKRGGLIEDRAVYTNLLQEWA